MGRRKGMLGRRATTFTKGNKFGFGACEVDVGCADQLPEPSSRDGQSHACHNPCYKRLDKELYERVVKSPIKWEQVLPSSMLLRPLKNCTSKLDRLAQGNREQKCRVRGQ